MKTRSIIGKRIVAVRQKRSRSNFGTTVYNIQSLQLDDGAKIVLNVVALDDRDPDSYAVEGIILPTRKVDR